jgi:TRAP-type C4-dicarboxylate transport system permease small subunit
MTIFGKVAKFMIYIGLGLCVFLMLLTVADVFMRTFFDMPITGVSEMARFIMVSLVLGMAWVALTDQNIIVDVVASRLSKRMNNILDAGTLVLGLVISVLITFQAVRETIFEYQFHYTGSAVFLVPTWPFWSLYTLGWFLSCIAIVLIIIQKVGLAFKPGSEKPAPAKTGTVVDEVRKP